jgi:hypothetical protein
LRRVGLDSLAGRESLQLSIVEARRVLGPRSRQDSGGSGVLVDPNRMDACYRGPLDLLHDQGGRNRLPRPVPTAHAREEVVLPPTVPGSTDRVWKKRFSNVAKDRRLCLRDQPSPLLIFRPARTQLKRAPRQRLLRELSRQTRQPGANARSRARASQASAPRSRTRSEGGSGGEANDPAQRSPPPQRHAVVAPFAAHAASPRTDCCAIIPPGQASDSWRMCRA